METLLQPSTDNSAIAVFCTMESQVAAVFQEMASRAKTLIEIKARWNADTLRLRLSWTNVTPNNDEMLALKMQQLVLEKMTNTRIHFTYYPKGRWIEYQLDKANDGTHDLLSALCDRINETMYFDL